MLLILFVPLHACCMFYVCVCVCVCVFLIFCTLYTIYIINNNSRSISGSITGTFKVVGPGGPFAGRVYGSPT